MKSLEKARENFLLIDKNLSEYATKSLESIRFKEEKRDVRTPFSRDADRIIHALSYNRYMDKTQVYSFKENDHISKRITHVSYVSKIARTIGRSLMLNTDLIEAIALGHDIGHTPLGHFGESVLNEISLRELGEYFAHNIQSVRQYMYVENNGKGLNLSLQVLDGIMCHNGEVLSEKYSPMTKDKDEFLREFEESYTDLDASRKYSPMTLEGCVVRLSDVIAYVGRDIEDAITLGILKRSDLPENITSVLGNNNRDIINTIIVDIVNNSIDKPYIMMSKDVYKALFNLKKYNYENIYSISLSKEMQEYYREGMNRIYSHYLKDIKNNDKDSFIYKIFLNTQSDVYNNSTSSKRKVIDFIAGMTDELFLSEIKRIK